MNTSKPTAKAATIRLYVTLTSLLTAVLALATAIVRLVVTLVSRLTNALEKTPRTLVAPTTAVAPAEAPAGQAKPARPNLRLVTATKQVDQLTFALVGMGFKVSLVSRFVGSLGDRVETAPLPDLIKEGLRALSAKVAS